jgi:hypothetical protein
MALRIFRVNFRKTEHWRLETSWQMTVRTGTKSVPD